MNGNEIEKNYVASHIKSLPKSGIREFFDLVNNMGEGVISLGVGEPDFASPWHIRESGMFSLEKGHTAYTSNLGLPALRKEISKYVSNNYNVQYDWKSECIVTIGVSEALDIAIRALVNVGDEVIYTEPCFVSYPAEIIMAHGVPVAVPTYEKDAFSLTPEALEKVITSKSKVLLLNFPCNPTGAVMSLDNLKKIAEIAIKHDLIVITDEIYSELIYDDITHYSIAAIDGMRERTIFLHGFSKAFAMTGWRIGYACGPQNIIDAMMKIHQYAIMSANTTSQEAAIDALKNGSKAMLKMREAYCERRNVMVKAFNEMGLSCHLPKGAFYTFPNIKSTGLSSKEFAKRLLEEQQVAVVPGGAFGASGEGYVRCCYATGITEIYEAMRRIKKFVESIK